MSTEAPPASYLPLTIDSGVRAAANRDGAKIALAEGRRTLNYRMLVDRIDRVGVMALAGLGLKPGDHAALMAPNCLEFIEIVCGLASRGIAVAMISPRMTAAEAAQICDDARARVLFMHPSLEPAIRAVHCETVERTVVIGEGYEDQLARATPAPPAARVPEWSTFAIPYTSGTTGRPKGVMLSHRSRTLTFFAMAVEYGCYSPDDRAVAFAPMCHGAGFAFAMAPVFFGGFCEILDRFEPEQVLAALSSTRASNVFMVPTHFHALFTLGENAFARFDGRALRAIISNAAPLPQATKEEIVRRFGAGLLHETYGSTEAGIVTNLRPADQLRKQKCVGMPFPATEVKLIGANGNEAEAGEVGELYSQSPYLFNGYWNRPDETAEALKQGWVTAGDMARMDEEGYIYLVDRKKDMLISGGMNIYPREIEEALYHHPDVSEAAVIGVPDDYWGEVVKAYVVRIPGHPLLENALIEYCRERLAGYKVPKSIEFIESLPKNAAGKVLKTILKARATEEPAHRR